MIQIELAAIANQSVAIRLDNRLYSLAVHETGGVMSVDITRDGETVLDGQRAVAGAALIPYNYLEAGNFVFVTEAGEYPDWRKFGTSHFLLYANAEELDAIRAAYAVDVVPVANKQALAAAGAYIPPSLTGFLLINNTGLRLTVGESGGYLYWRR
jgi:hypothetical protein